MEFIGTASSGTRRVLGRNFPKQSSIYKRGIVDIENGGDVERFTFGLWRLEEYEPKILPLARQGNLGKTA
jgi:hypothetical protein